MVTHEVKSEQEHILMPTKLTEEMKQIMASFPGTAEDTLEDRLDDMYEALVEYVSNLRRR